MTGSAEDDDIDGDETEHDPCPDFQPVIPLPAEIELTTGEEEENVLFESRAKLFRCVSYYILTLENHLVELLL